MFFTNAFPRQVRVIISPACSLPVTHAGSILVRSSTLSRPRWTSSSLVSMFLKSTWAAGDVAAKATDCYLIYKAPDPYSSLCPHRSVDSWILFLVGPARPSGLRLGHSVLIWMTLNLTHRWRAFCVGRPTRKSFSRQHRSWEHDQMVMDGGVITVNQCKILDCKKINLKKAKQHKSGQTELSTSSENQPERLGNNMTVSKFNPPPPQETQNIHL